MSKILISKKYLKIPVNINAEEKELNIIIDGKSEYKLVIRIDDKKPEFFAFIDVQRFMGREVLLNTEPVISFNVVQCDEMDLPDLYNEELRPKVHFTVKNGWNNDPNGLVYSNGEYHLFFQYNPCAPQWRNMHWGHAVSRDLIHWEEIDTALFPDELGDMFSGSAIVDENNILGLQKNDNKTVVLFYTAAGKQFTQCMAYSIDNGRTFIKYNNNPLIQEMERENRDPKVVWCEPVNSYIMALYLINDMYCLLKSVDLIHWEIFQEIKLNDDNECPDIFHINSNGEDKWVFMGAKDTYLVGEFKDGHFCPVQEQLKLKYGGSRYAAQSYSNVPGNRIIRIGWHGLNIQHERFSQQMSIPSELTLEKFGDKYYVCENPVKELELIYAGKNVFNGINVKSSESFKEDLSKSAYYLELNMEYDLDKVIKIKLFGAEIVIDMNRNIFSFAGQECPLSIERRSVSMKILIDTCSLELYADNGKICAAYQFISDYSQSYLEIESNKDIILEKLAYCGLNSVWNI